MTIDKLVKNFTPHTINIKTGDSTTVSIPPEIEPKQAPRLTLTESDRTTIRVCGGTITVLGGRKPTGVHPELPPLTPGTVIIVPRAIAEYLADREDLVWPDLLTRDAQGSVTGCEALGTLHPEVFDDNDEEE
ncbi:MAG: hypothetical protein Q4C85_11590 [Actinomyces sp.]|uniref:hypothetical protein n=1 Tax=Actinomyces sp. TaxID=29317 RepID=UPI0026DD621D|nr:hypothetical protein [Actinomyces sp.]MDO4244367.1 hypothetical protein [Actinomyces sp.]